MAKQIQLRRGTEAENKAFTGALAELTMDTTNNRLRLHDGVTAGGHSVTTTQIADIIVQVPEDYATVNEALSYLTETYNPTHGFTSEVSLASSYVIAEQILVDGQDLSWIKLTSRSTTGTGYESGKHLVDRSALTTEFTASEWGFTSYPAFGAKNGASSPILSFVLDGQVVLESATVDDNKMGIVAVGATVNCNKTAGAIQMSSYACYARSGSISAHIMTNSSNSSYTCYADSGSISAHNMTNSSDSSYACYARSGSISAHNMTNSSNSNMACHARSGSISARNMTNSSNSGIACYADSGSISAHSMTNSSDISHACYARSGSISARNMILSNTSASTAYLTYVIGGGFIKSVAGTWTNKGTAAKANQAPVTVTANGYINRIG